jgi:hypothetical protein
MTDTPIFFLITADDCGACVNFKNNMWPVIKKDLEESKSVTIVHRNLEFRRDRDKLKLELGEDILKFVPHYPSMALITAESWKEKKQLNGIIFNGTINPQGKFERLPDNRQLKFDKIFEWVKINLQLPPFKVSNNTPQPIRPVLIHDVNEGNVKSVAVCSREFLPI